MSEHPIGTREEWQAAATRLGSSRGSRPHATRKSSGGGASSPGFKRSLPIRNSETKSLQVARRDLLGGLIHEYDIRIAA
jgi:hypothetical protein